MHSLVCFYYYCFFFFSNENNTHTLFHCPFFSLFFFFLSPLLRLCSASPFFFFHVRCSADPHKYTRRVVFQGVFYIFSFSFFVLHFVQIPLLLNSIGLLKKLSSPFFFFQVACVCVRLLVLLSCVVSTLHYISCPYFLFFFFFFTWRLISVCGIRTAHPRYIFYTHRFDRGGERERRAFPQ